MDNSLVSRRGKLSVGLLGGSFNPAHDGHMHVAEIGLRELDLDQVWWLVTPQNPLKPEQPSYESRVATVEALNLPPQMRVSHMEQEFGTQYTIDTITRAQQRWPDINFVFLMGADNFLQLPQWKNWQEIMERVPIAVIARPGADHKPLKARLGHVARQYADYRVPESQASELKYCAPPAWVYLTTPLNRLSSTQIRKRNQSNYNAS